MIFFILMFSDISAFTLNGLKLKVDNVLIYKKNKNAFSSKSVFFYN